MFDPSGEDDPLSQPGVDVCPECRTVLQDDGCHGCGWMRPAVPRVKRPTDGDELPGVWGA